MSDPLLELAQEAVALAMTIVEIEDALDAAEEKWIHQDFRGNRPEKPEIIDTIRNIINEGR